MGGGRFVRKVRSLLGLKVKAFQTAHRGHAGSFKGTLVLLMGGKKPSCAIGKKKAL